MTPQEKANYLINKYFNAVEHKNTSRKLAKKLALICADEVIKEHCHESEHKEPNAQDKWIEYWQSVKAELNAL